MHNFYNLELAALIDFDKAVHKDFPFKIMIIKMLGKCKGAFLTA